MSYICGKLFKKSENKIKELLENNNINYIYQYRNKEKFGKMNLDFYLPEHNIAIEYQGKQHFQAVKIFKGDIGLEKTLKRDKEKYEICQNNNIKLL
jgi:very-short-patch-repair endonuclease